MGVVNPLEECSLLWLLWHLSKGEMTPIPEPDKFFYLEAKTALFSSETSVKMGLNKHFLLNVIQVLRNADHITRRAIFSRVAAFFP